MTRLNQVVQNAYSITMFPAGYYIEVGYCTKIVFTKLQFSIIYRVLLMVILEQFKVDICLHTLCPFRNLARTEELYK